MNTAPHRIGFIVRNARVLRCCVHQTKYVTPLDMVKEFDATDLAQVATHQERAQITGDLLVLGIQNASLNASIEQQLSVSSAIQVICTACQRTDALTIKALESHPRYKSTLVFDENFLHSLKLYGLDIARYYLYDNAVPEIVQKRYDAAMAWLKQLENGEIMLLTIPPLQKSYAYFSAQPRHF